MSEQTLKATIQVRTVKSGPQAFIEVPTRKGSREAALAKQLLSKSLAALFAVAPENLKGREVEYRLRAGQLDRVWEAGATWDGGDPAPRPPGHGGRSGGHPDLRGHTGGARPPSLHTDQWFENPYNFVPASPRDTNHPTLGDAEPAGHHRYHPELWSGRIGVELTTCTPLLVPDLGRDSVDGHRVYGLRLDEDGVPYLPPTSIKGALRSAYEAMTNSRMGIFQGLSEPLAMRHVAQSGADVVPVRVSDDGTSLELLTGTSSLTSNGPPSAGQPQCAAWVPYYSTQRLLRRGRSLVRHGNRVWARIQEWQHYRRKRNRQLNRDEWRPDFRFWRSLELAPDGPSAPQNSPDPRRPRH